MKRKFTADERDRKIVAKAGPWRGTGVYFTVYACGVKTMGQADGAAKALARIANRIVKEEKP